VRILKTALIILAIIFIGIQFVRPDKNAGTVDPAKEISAAVPVPAEVDTMLRESCYDCHSNVTRYPWYAEVMPAGWLLADHVDEGKGQLNFSEFAAGSLRRQYHKLEEISEQINEGEMPLKSYLIMHGGAELTGDKKDVLNRWVEASRASMRGRYPADSLERRRNGPPQRRE
jgi:hypothetical protein